jgi:hypothetical protein
MNGICAATVVNIHHGIDLGDPDVVYIGRPGKGRPGPLGNPIQIGKPCPACGDVHTRDTPAFLDQCYYRWLCQKAERDSAYRALLYSCYGKRLACFCAPAPCHGHVIARWLRERIDHVALDPPAISLWQPWATAITHAGKRIENREWPCPLPPGSRVCLHAAAKVDKDIIDILREDGHKLPDDLPRMALVGTARFVCNVDSRVDPRLDEVQARSWWAGPIGWLLDDVHVFDEPLPCPGSRKLWSVLAALPLSVRDEVEERIAIREYDGQQERESATEGALRDAWDRHGRAMWRTWSTPMRRKGTQE